MYQNFIPFYCRIIFHCIDIPHFIHSSIDEHVGCFHLLAIMIDTAMSSHVQVFGWAYVFLFLRCISRNGPRMTPVILRSGQDRWWCCALRAGTLDENQVAGQEWGGDDGFFLRGVEFVSFEISK